MKIKCLLADDEPPARELLASYINRLDDLELCGQCADSLGTFKYLQKNEDVNEKTNCILRLRWNDHN